LESFGGDIFSGVRWEQAHQARTPKDKGRWYNLTQTINGGGGKRRKVNKSFQYSLTNPSSGGENRGSPTF